MRPGTGPEGTGETMAGVGRTAARRDAGTVRRALLAAACALTVAVLGTPGVAGATTGATGAPSRPSAGCTLAQPAAPGASDQLFSAAGDAGAYVREIPPTDTGRTPLALVIDLHGYEEPASLQAELSGLGAYGATHGFVTVTPQVTDPVPMWQTGPTSDDVKFIGALLTHVEDTLCVDENRVFVTGYSNGAFLTSTIACVDADRVAAVAAVAGLENPKGCDPARRIPILAFHGTKDPFVSYTGGLGPAALGLEAPNGSGQTIGQSLGKDSKLSGGPSVPSIVAAWAAREGCAPTPKVHEVASDVTLIRYPCAGTTDVELYRVTGGGHAWPGSAISASIKSVVGYTTMAISADQIMWQFFEAHPLRR